MARWKAHVEFLLSVIELLFLSLTIEALGRGRSLGAKISGGGSHPSANILIPLSGKVLAQ